MIGHAAGIYAMHQRSGLGSVADRPVADEGHPSSCSADQIGMIRFIRQVVVVRGLASHVNCLKGCEEVPRHSRSRGARLPADDAHYEGTSTERIVAPTGPAWAGACGSSPRSPWRSDRWISMPHWRRCHDERQASLAGYRCHPRAVAGEGLLRADEMLDEALAHAFLDKLLGVEMDRRKERRIRTSLRLSSLPTGQTLETHLRLPAQQRALPHRDAGHRCMDPELRGSVDFRSARRRQEQYLCGARHQGSPVGLLRSILPVRCADVSPQDQCRPA